MNNKELEEKINNLEIKMAYQESTIEELNSIVSSQEKEIGKAQNHIQKIERKIEEMEESGGGEGDLPSRIPPHY
jgi:SlyX protein